MKRGFRVVRKPPALVGLGVEQLGAGEQNNGIQDGEHGRRDIAFLGRLHPFHLGPGPVHGLIADDGQKGRLDKSEGEQLPGAFDAGQNT